MGMAKERIMSAQVNESQYSRGNLHGRQFTSLCHGSADCDEVKVVQQIVKYRRKDHLHFVSFTRSFLFCVDVIMWVQPSRLDHV